MVTFPVYASFQQAFDEIGRIASEKRIVFVIDEYPYLAKVDPMISSRLQHLIDLKWKSGKLFLVLCGSSASFMEDEVLAYESPLFGRRTGQIHLLPMSYRDTALFHPGLDCIANAEIYGVTGGVPLYIEKLDVRKDMDEPLLRNVFNQTSCFFEESENLLKQELREPSTYNAIIKAIAEGSTKLSGISSKTGLDKNACTTYIKTLIDLGIVEKETPFLAIEGRRSIYRISDLFFSFLVSFCSWEYGRCHDRKKRKDISICCERVSSLIYGVGF